MVAWPTTGGSEGTWNDEMKAFIGVEHNADGTHKATEITAVVTGEGIFGSWTNKDSSNNTLVKTSVYQVGSDGFVCAYANTFQPSLDIYTDGNNPPTTMRFHLEVQGDADNRPSASIPIRKGDYWKVIVGGGTPTIYWLPIGSGTCIKQ